jgi:geranylgeranyl diphosphate synthase, type I
MSQQGPLLIEEILAAIEPIRSDAGLYQLVRDCLPLIQPEQDQRPKIMPLFLLPELVCEAVSGRSEQAVPLAAALQLFRAAGDLFDDLEDGDLQGTVACAKPGIAINAATTLLILGQKALLRLANRGVDTATILQIIETINAAYARACLGQHLDLSAPRDEVITEETYLKIAALKTGTSVECACRTGALLAGADVAIIDLFGTWGNNLGIASQIANDIQGILNLKDIFKPQITLPVIFALNQSGIIAHAHLASVFRQAHTPPEEARIIQKAIIEVGAVQYATIKLEYYKLRARDILERIEASGIRTDQLKMLIA